MFLELIAVFVAGFAGAGVIMALGALLRGRLPRWAMPIAAGAAMIGTAVTLEYSWYARTAANLPDGLTIAQTVDSRALWRPWTYAVPLTDRFVAVDLAAAQANSNDPALWLTDLYFFGRWRPVTSVEVMVDCAAGRRADPTFGDGSEPVWRDVGAGDPVVRTLCQGA